MKEICNRCKDIIKPMDEIWYPKGETVCGYCIISKEVDNYIYTDNCKENK